MNYEGGLFEARSIGELDAQLRGLSENGFRIINVLDRSSTYDDRFLIVAKNRFNKERADHKLAARNALGGKKF